MARDHFVPDFLIKNFGFAKGNPKEKYVYVFDKTTKRVTLNNTKKIFSEKNLYDFQSESGKSSFEDTMAKLETSASQIIKSVIENNSLGHLNEEDKTGLVTFTAAQFLRCERYLKSPSRIYDKIRNEHLSLTKDLNVFFNSNLTPLEKKTLDLDLFVEKMPLIISALQNKAMFLYVFDKRVKLYLSDHPTVPYNLSKKIHGIADPDTNVFLPISPNHSLAFTSVNLQKAITTLTSIKKGNGLDKASRHLRFYSDIQEGKSISGGPQQAHMINTLQIIWAQSRIVSAENNFNFAREFLRRTPEAERPYGMS